ncbi:sulfatase domain-containing protein [Massilia sp. Root418]|jgi:glucan phosphoethanolaminetransferase (alkaline phosphatase superfamily)|uniref:phosphoethanolamine transferase n=1 Tax=Massilia sp. Root418 TaxID=1736532 RepID=UPI0006FF0F13|nr:phosphoethanolamine transferase [Massilia sp. Root418]KQX00180.1 sulfatase domain-containing protein [Massilia sp. Root418]
MRLLFRPTAPPASASLGAQAFLLLSYLALSAVPFVPLLLGKPVDAPWQTLGMEVVAWIAVWAVFKRPAWFHWLLLPAFLALPTEVYLIVYYGQGISTHHLGIIAETSPKEAMEFLGRTVYLMAAVLAGVIVWFGAAWYVAVKTRALAWSDVSRWVALGIVAALACVAGYGWEFGVAGKPAVKHASAPASAPAASVHASGFGDGASAEVEDAEEEEAASASETGAVAAAGRSGWKLAPLAWWAKVPVDFAAFANTWPFGLMARGVDFYHERQHLAELGRTSSSFTFHARQAEGNDAPQVVVMVLGESSRYDRWSLNGYTRETNPLLAKEGNLVALRDVITSVSATRLSVPVIISRKPAMQSLKDGFAEKSFITAYKEAGFKTYWLSNQISFGQFDTPVSVFAKEADVIQFLNLGGFTNNSNFDQVLFDPLKHALADPAPKKLIVLHSLGSHWNYSQRHPKEFDKWQPSLYGINKPAYTDLKIKPQLNNSYDNSILYTDWFLAQVIGTLKAQQAAASMLYVADHGQTLYDGTCRLAFHGHNTQYEFHVPAFVWYSDQYGERYPDKVQQLAKHKKARLATENMFHTLLDMADIRYQGERLEWSFLSAKFKQHKRYVDSYGWTNYDNAIIKGDCREVIDKNKPLKQD